MVKDTEMKCRIQGVASIMHSFDFFYGLMLGQLLLQHSDNFSMALQSQSMSALDGQTIAHMTICTIESMRSDESFKLFWKKVSDLAGSLDVSNPTLPRQRKRPCIYETGLSDSSFLQTVEELYRIMCTCIVNYCDASNQCR